MGNHIEKINHYAEKGKANKILSYLKSKDQETRLAAIKALGRCSNSEEAFNQLTPMMTSTSDKTERMAVYSALGDLGKEQSFYHMSHYMSKETDPEILETMRKAMSKIRQHKE